ncbi:MAG: amidohydrolase [Deltaproteobacteria bacterium]|nr:amidohydrolase [Deltaproteobacteria bacterium]
MTAEHSLAPDLLLINGKILTVDAQDRVAHAVAVAGGRILAVGDTREILPLRGRGTEVIDLQGRTLLPGLTDPHLHLADKGTSEMHNLDCRDFYTDVRSISQILDRFAARAAELAEGTWLVAHGSPMQDFRMPEGRFPTRWELDRAAPRHPAAISFGAHITIVNSLGLARAGITRETPDPAGGSIERDPGTGELTGKLRERAQLLVKKVLTPYSHEQLKAGILHEAAKCLERGVTTIHDIVIANRAVRAYQELWQEGRLPLRVSLLIRVIEAEIVPESLLNLGLFTGFGNDWLKLGGIKLSIDGGITGRNAAFSEPYVGEPHNCGLIRIPQEELEDVAGRYHRAGHRLCIHAIGDVAFDMVLRALDRILSAHPRPGHRHRIEHMGNWLCTPERVALMRRHGILPVPNIAYLHFVGDSILACLGPERMRDAFPLKTLLGAGFPLTSGSDAPGYWPVDVLRDIGAAVARRTWMGQTLAPGEALSIRDAIRMYTVNAAYAGFEERIKGSVEPGKLADLAVLAEDPFAVPPEKLKEIPVDLTIVDGRVAYRREEAWR